MECMCEEAGIAASSSGFSRSVISGMVRDRKDQRLEIYRECKHWRLCLGNIWASSSVHFSTHILRHKIWSQQPLQDVGGYVDIGVGKHLPGPHCVLSVHYEVGFHIQRHVLADCPTTFLGLHS